MEVNYIYYPKLKDLREDGGYVQKEIVVSLGIDQRGYNTYETGKREIPTRYVIKLAHFYKTSTDYILRQSDIQAPYGRKHRF